MNMQVKNRDEDVWRALLAGQRPEIVKGEVYCGAWRSRSRDGREYVIRTYRAADDRIYAWNGLTQKSVLADAEWAEQHFGFLLKRPATAAEYNHFVEFGRFPDSVDDSVERAQAKAQASVEASAVGANAEAHIMLSETITELRREAEAWLRSIGGEVTTQEHADKAGNYADRLAELQREAEQARVAEKQPHLDASREVDGKWQPVVKAGADAKAWAKNLCTPYLKAQRQKADAAVAAEGATSATPPKVKAGTRGRAVTLRTRRIGTVSDPAAFAAWLVQTNNPDMRDLLHKLAQRIASAAGQAPGIEIVEEQAAA